MRSIRLFVIVAIGCLASGCFKPEQPPCSYACSVDTLCPENYVCLPDGYCHRKDYLGACSFSDAAVQPDQAVTPDMTGADLTSVDATATDLPLEVDMAGVDLTGADLTELDLTTSADLTMPPDLTAVPDLTIPPDLTVVPDLTMPPDLTTVPDMTAVPDFANVDMAFQMLAPCGDPMNYTVAGTLLPTVEFGGAKGNNYAPNCLQVSLGAMVTFSGNGGADFGFHPLNPSTRGSGNNPITVTATGTMKTFAFDEVGFFPFFCSNHGDNAGNGMAGVIHVVP